MGNCSEQQGDVHIYEIVYSFVSEIKKKLCTTVFTGDYSSFRVHKMMASSRIVPQCSFYAMFKFTKSATATTEAVRLKCSGKQFEKT